MLTKSEILQQIKLLAAQQVLKKEEVIAACEEGVATERSKMAAVLYYIGGAIVFWGVFILLAQKWAVLSELTKISVTLGSGIAAYYVGLLFSQDQRTVTMSSAFFLISALLMPLGLWVVFDNIGYNIGDEGLQSFIFAILFLVYYGSFFIFKRSIFILFGVIFATALFFNFNYFLIGSKPFFGGEYFFSYLVFSTGLSYLLLGYYLSCTQHNRLLGFFYGFGILFFLGAAFCLGGWKPTQRLSWEMVFPILVFGSLLLSVRLKSKALLTFGALFLMAYLIKITDEYFVDNVGWPLSLVIAGLSLIAVGYLFLKLKKNI